MMSSQEIFFAPADGLTPRMKVEIVFAWPPCRLDGHNMQLVLQVTIIGIQDGVVEACIFTHHFRTAGPESDFGAL
jgi:hypothetical protein